MLDNGILQLLRLSQFSQAPQNAENDMQQTTSATSQPGSAQVAPQQQSAQPTSAPQQNDNQQSQADQDINDVGGPIPSQQQNGPVTGLLHGFLDGFQPQTAARDQLSHLMQNMPQYQEPGFFSKLEAGLIGATRGPQAAEQYLESPYNRQMNQWKNQAAVAQQAASDENYSNNLNRQLSQFAQGNQEKYDALTEKANEASGKLGVAQQRMQVYQQNADTNAAKLDVMRQTALGGQIQFLPDNTAIMVHKDGTSVPVTGVDGNTPVLFSPQDKQQMINDAAMMREQAGQAGSNERNAATIANSAANNAANNDQKNWTFFQDKNGNWFRGNSATGAMTPVNGAPQGGTTIPHPQPTPSGTVTTTETKTPNNWFQNYILREGPETVSKSTVSTKEPTTPGAPQSNQVALPDINSRVIGKTTATINGIPMIWSSHSDGTTGWSPVR